MLLRVTVITLVLSSHLSMCAGSLFSVGMALASRIAVSEQGVMMTPDIHRPLCALSTPHEERGNQATDSQCNGGKKCSTTPSALSFVSPLNDQHEIVSAPQTFASLSDQDDVNMYDMSIIVKPPGRQGLLIASVVRRE